MDKIYHDLVTDVKITDRSLIWNTDLIEGLELQNLMINAKQVISTKPPCCEVSISVLGTIFNRSKGVVVFRCFLCHTVK